MSQTSPYPLLKWGIPIFNDTNVKDFKDNILKSLKYPFSPVLRLGSPYREKHIKKNVIFSI